MLFELDLNSNRVKLFNFDEFKTGSIIRLKITHEMTRLQGRSNSRTDLFN